MKQFSLSPYPSPLLLPLPQRGYLSRPKKTGANSVWRSSNLSLVIFSPRFPPCCRRKTDRQHLGKLAFSLIFTFGENWTSFLSSITAASFKAFVFNFFQENPVGKWILEICTRWTSSECRSTHSLLCRPRTTVRRLGSFVTSNPLAQPSMPSWFLKQWAAVSTWRLSIDALINTEIQYTIHPIG